MTFSIAAHCLDTGAVGVAVATYSLACGTRARAATGRGAIMSQGFASPPLSLLGIHLLEQGLTAPEIRERLRASDPDFAWRQISLRNEMDRRFTMIAQAEVFSGNVQSHAPVRGSQDGAGRIAKWQEPGAAPVD